MREIGRGVLTAPVYRSGHCRTIPQGVASMPIKSSGRIVPPGWAPLQPKQSVLSLIV